VYDGYKTYSPDECNECTSLFFKAPAWTYEPAIARFPLPPTDTDVQRTLRRLANIDEDIGSHEKQIEWLTKELARAQDDLDNMIACKDSYTKVVKEALVSSDRDSCGNSAGTASSFSAIPAELWTEIFILVLYTDSDETLVSLKYLGTVCQTWRRIINTSFTLWTRLNIHTDPENGCAIVNSAMERSNGLPLDISLVPSSYEQNKIAIDNNAHRIRSIRLQMSRSSDSYPPPHLFQKLSNLEALQITEDGWAGIWDDWASPMSTSPLSTHTLLKDQ